MDLLNPPLHHPGFLWHTDQGPLLKVYDLACGRWHTHGGDSHRPGDIVSLLSHCGHKGQSHEYTVQIWADPFHPGWADRDGRLNIVGYIRGTK
jgi:hypothetical protein